MASPDEFPVHLRGEVDDGLPADIDADLAPHELSHVVDRLVGTGVGTASGNRECSLEEPLQSGREGAAAANLRDLDHFHQQRWQGVGVFVQSQIAAEDERHAAKRDLRDIGGSIEVNGAIAGG